MYGEIKTPRLRLSPLSERHLQQFLTVAGTRHVADTTISVPHPLTEEDAREWIRRAITESADGRAAHFAICPGPDESSFIGYVAVKAIDREHGEGELGCVANS
jgi:RimJ/RimL family protein N-acetyltransferase